MAVRSPLTAALSAPFIGALILAIRLYQWLISSRLPNVCVFEPSCSEFAILAIREHGLRKGATLAWERIQRCDGGTDRGLDLPPGCDGYCRDPSEPSGLIDVRGPVSLDELPEHTKKQITSELEQEDIIP